MTTLPLKELRMLFGALEEGVYTVWPSKKEAGDEAIDWWNEAMGESGNPWTKEDIQKAAASLFILWMIREDEAAEIALRN